MQAHSYLHAENVQNNLQWFMFPGIFSQDSRVESQSASCLLSPQRPHVQSVLQWILLIPVINSSKHSSLSLPCPPVSPSASLKEATRHGAWRMCVAGHLCSRKATLITPSTTTTQFSLHAKALAPQGCKVRPRDTHCRSNKNVPAAFWRV